jgi:hypothetical protein
MFFFNLFPVFIIFLVIVVALFALMRYVGRQGQHQTDVKSSPVDMLRYQVPEGQDPAIVLAALQKEGFHAIPDVHGAGASHDVLIPCPEGVDRHRAHVRSIIQGTEQINYEGDQRQIPQVRFADE